MNFAVINHTDNEKLKKLFDPVIARMEECGDHRVDPGDDPDFFINIFNMDNPRSVSRTRKEQKVISITTSTDRNNNLRTHCFRVLVKTLSNMLFCIPLEKGSADEASYTTPEGSYVNFDFSDNNFRQAIEPVTHSRFVFGNRLEIRPGIPDEEISKAEQQLAMHSRKLDELGIVPSPFSLKDILSPKQIRSIYRLYKIRGLSYGNMSLRRNTGNPDHPAFWMSARGVDKSNIRVFGKDFLLIEDYDEEAGELVVAVPEDHDPACRVSVDGIEHYMIYKAFPDVCAIVHVHAWIDGVEATQQNHPCGTHELAVSVADLVRADPDPGKAIIGLKNHGLTITGPDLDNIFNRISGRIRTGVPMKL